MRMARPVGVLGVVAVSALGALLGTACRHDAPQERGAVSGPRASADPGAPASGSTAPGSPGAAAAGSRALVPVPAAIAAQVQLREIARGLSRPVLLLAAPGDARRRLFVLEQHTGTVRVLEGPAHALQAAPFVTIGGLSTGNEQGLLGLAFDPQFATTGRFYVNYTAANKATHIVELHAAPGADVADAKPLREIAVIPQPYSNHNGGNLLFGPDGKLYVGMGDGGSAGDPSRNGQNPKAYLGKLLRYDVAQPAPRAEIVHLGLRNPWRFWFDAPTGDLYIGDVGQNLWENVYVVAGTDHTQHNFGWNVVEGNHCFDAATCDRAGFTAPVADYSHDVGCSITGGATYRGKALPALAGAYFYADFCTTLVRSFRWQAGGLRDHWDWKAALDPTNQLSEITSFGVDADGELYVLSLGGTIWQLAPRG